MVSVQTWKIKERWVSKTKDFLRNTQRWSFITVLYKRRLRVGLVREYLTLSGLVRTKKARKFIFGKKSCPAKYSFYIFSLGILTFWIFYVCRSELQALW